MWAWWTKRKHVSELYRDRISTLIILILLLALLESTQILSRLNHIVFDLGQQWGVQASSSQDIVIVAIDQQSLATLGQRNWPRNLHAALIERLTEGHPAAIGYDMIFAEHDSQTAPQDALLANAVKHAGNLVFPVLFEQSYFNGPIIETLPTPIVRQYAAAFGSAHTVLDDDSITRGIYMREGLGKAYWPLFAQAVLTVAQQHDKQDNPPARNQSNIDIRNADIGNIARKDYRMVNFSGKPGYFQTISFSKVIAGDFPKDYFLNKIVLVGATASGMNDMLTTPVSADSVPMSGVEFHANVVEALRQHSLISVMPHWLSFGLVLVCACVPLIWLPKTSSGLGFAFTLVYCLLLFAIFLALPKLLHWWCPPASALVVSFMAFPIWSWRKLEATQHYIDFEIQKLNQKANVIKSDEGLDSHYDYLDRRIVHLRAAARRIDQMQSEKDDTLSFLSHDIKAPIATVLAMLAEQRASPDALRKPLQQALNLAEAFLQTAKAEQLDATQMHECELMNLFQEVLDDAYAYAQQRHIKLQTITPLEAVWLEANYALLARALFNLIHNAIKYSPQGASVNVSISKVTGTQNICIQIENSGEGIASDQMDHLFKRYQRLPQHQDSHPGTGLGLYFTKLVIEKHGGSITVNSETNAKTCFSLILPYTQLQNSAD